MRVRRVLWLCLSALVALGLYLFLPPKPRWVLPKDELPLRINSNRILTMRVDPSQALDQDIRRIQDGGVNAVIIGSLQLHDLKSGEITGVSREHTPNDGCVARYSTNLRYTLIDHQDQATVCVYDFEAGTHWTMPKGEQEYFSPNGTLMHVWRKDRDDLFESGSGRLLASFPANYRYAYEIASDDSWALFTGFEFDGDSSAGHWLHWRRDGNVITKGKFDGGVAKVQIAPDGSAAAVLRNLPNENRHRLEIWDGRSGRVIRSWDASTEGEPTVQFCPTGKRLALWWQVEPGKPKAIQFFDVATGKIAAVPTNTRVEGGIFSRNGDLYAIWDTSFPQSVVVIDVAAGIEKRHWVNQDLFFESLIWTNAASDQLLGLQSNAGQVGDGRNTVLHDVASGQRFPARSGSVSTDNQVLLRMGDTRAGDEMGWKVNLLRRLPWLKNREFFSLTAERVADGHELFRRLETALSEEAPKQMVPVYCDRNTLVLMCAGRGDTEIWDLPPARRWLWILGPALGLAALPWLRRMVRRKRSAPAAGQFPAS